MRLPPARLPKCLDPFDNIVEMISLREEIDFQEELRLDPSLAPFLDQAASEFDEKFDHKNYYKPEKTVQYGNHLVVLGFPANLKNEDKLVLFKEKAMPKLEEKTHYRRGLLREEWGRSEGRFNGCLFLEYDNPKMCQYVKEIFNNIIFLRHELRCFSFVEARQIINLVGFQKPVVIGTEHHLGHALDKTLRQQFVVFVDKELNLNWVNHLEKETSPANQEKVKLEDVKRIEWSVSGSCLVCIRANGFDIRAGHDFSLIHFCAHNAVKNVQFSNDEKYILSFNGTTKAPDFENYIVWDSASGARLAVVRAKPDQNWGSCQFSPDSDKLLMVFRETGHLKVFQLPGLQQLKSVQMQSLQGANWHPLGSSVSMVSYTNNPKVQSKIRILTQQFCFKDEGEEKAISWKPAAYDASSHERIAFAEDNSWTIVALKEKKGEANLNIALKAKGSLTYKSKRIEQKFVNFSAEASSGLFAVATIDPATEESLISRHLIRIFKVIDNKGVQILELGSYGKKEANQVLFSGNSVFFVLANLDHGPYRGCLEFGMILQDSKGNYSLSVLKADIKIPQLIYAQYDPSGRLFMASSYSQYTIWSALGEVLCKDSFVQPIRGICWRPVPKVLTTQMIKDVIKDFANYAPAFKQQDEEVLNRAIFQKKAKRQQMRKQFTEYLSVRRSLWQSNKEQLKRVLGLDPSSKKNYQTLRIRLQATQK